MELVLAVDGGNTKTIALVARPDGTIIGTGRGGCSDIYGAVSIEAALQEATTAVSAALRSAGIDSSELAVAVFSMAGADWPEDAVFLESAMRERGFGRRIIVVNDAMGALRAGSSDGYGVVVACGTGTAIGARAPDGRAWHTGWWQEPQGSRHLTQKTLRAVYRAELGIDPPTRLTGRVLEIFRERSVEDVLHRLTARLPTGPDKSGEVTCALLEEAAGGDTTAWTIVREHGTALGGYAVAAARRVGILNTAFSLVLAGGVLRHPSALLADAIVERVRLTSPEARPVVARYEPVAGALLLALEAAGIPIDEPLLGRMGANLPSADLFATRSCGL